MMAGEIGASVIVVKEIEVPKDLVEINERLAARYVDFETGEVKRSKRTDPVPALDSGDTTTSTSAESDIELPASDLFSMDPDGPVRTASSTNLDLEISSVYKPRPMRARVSFPPGAETGRPHKGPGKKKPKALPPAFHALTSPSNPSLAIPDAKTSNKQQTKGSWRRQARDKRRDDKKQTSEETEISTTADSLSLIPDLGSLHVSIEPNATANTAQAIVPAPSLPSKVVLGADSEPKRVADEGPRLIVEALVVRKLSLEEAYLDFGGFGFEL